MSKEIHVNDIGTILKVTIKVNGVALTISPATVKRIIITDPDGRKLNKPAAFDSDGSDGVLKYIIVDGDLEKAGTWQLQAKVTLSGGSWSSDIATFEVAENL